MLHESDIIKRLKDFPEPDEVKEIRENIKNSFRRLEFQEGPHKYYVHNDDGSTTELPSVSGICHQFEPEADWDAIKARYAVKNGYTVEEVTRMWHETNIQSTNRGTQTHLYGECLMHVFQGDFDVCEAMKMRYEDGYFIPYAPKEESVMAYYTDIYKMFYDDSVKSKMYPVMPESQIYMFEDGPVKQRYAGTFDILHAFKARDGKWKLIVHDFKSNGSLTSEFNRAKGNMMLPPFEEFWDEPLGHYSAQLSLYQLGLQQLGYEVVDRKLIWLKEDGTYQKIPVPDVTDKLIQALN